MPKRAPSPLAAWAVLSLPLMLLVAGCFAFIGQEDAVARHFVQWRAANPRAELVVRLYTDWGNPALYLVFAGMLVRGVKRSRPDLTALALAYLAAQLLFSLAIERLLKVGLGRPRPGTDGPFAPWSLDDAHNALPSGHTTEMTVQTSTLALHAQGLAWPLILGVALALMAASRLALGAHHPTDILGGWALGSLGGAFARWLAPRLTPSIAPRLARMFATKGSR